MEKFIFLGDSITDSHRLWLPEYEGLGNGYLHLLKDPMESLGISIWNKGHDGFTLPFLLRTLERDCLKHQPDGVSILIGINDVGVSQNTGKSLADQEFGANYDCLIRRLLQQDIKKIFLMGPFLFPKPQEFLNWMEDVGKAEDIVRSSARRYHLPFLPLHHRMNQAAREYGTDAVTLDGIHLSDFGHGLLARWWWEAFQEELVSF